jgi:hypothetical protein
MCFFTSRKLAELDNTTHVKKTRTRVLNWPTYGKKKSNLHTNELNTTFFCSTSSLKAPNRLKSCCDIYQNPFTYLEENSQILTVSNKNCTYNDLQSRKC